MRELDHYDVERVTRALPMEIKACMHTLPVFAAGGLIRSLVAKETINDIDLFVSDEATVDQIILKLVNCASITVSKTENAVTIHGMRFPVQIIHRWKFATPQECVESFDFTIARAAVWMTKENAWQSACDDRFYQDVAAKRLVYCNPDRHEDAGGSMLRLLKFYSRGYTAPLMDVSSVMARMTHGNDPTKNKVDLQEIAKNYLTLLREVDPLNTREDF